MLLSYISYKNQPRSQIYKSFSNSGEVTVAVKKNLTLDKPIYSEPQTLFVVTENNSRTIIGGKCVNIETKVEGTYKHHNDREEPCSLYFLAYRKPYSTELTFVENPKHVYIGLSRSLFKRDMQLGHQPSTVVISVKDNGLGSGSGTLGDLEMTIEVQRLEEKKIKFPSGYLDGLQESSIATKEIDTLTIWSSDLGKTTLYTDKGSINIITMPGYKINKSKESTIAPTS